MECSNKQVVLSSITFSVNASIETTLFKHSARIFVRRIFRSPRLIHHALCIAIAYTVFVMSLTHNRCKAKCCADMCLLHGFQFPSCLQKLATSCIVTENEKKAINSNMMRVIQTLLIWIYQVLLNIFLLLNARVALTNTFDSVNQCCRQVWIFQFNMVLLRFGAIKMYIKNKAIWMLVRATTFNPFGLTRMTTNIENIYPEYDLKYKMPYRIHVQIKNQSASVRREAEGLRGLVPRQAIVCLSKFS